MHFFFRVLIYYTSNYFLEIQKKKHFLYLTTLIIDHITIKFMYWFILWNTMSYSSDKPNFESHTPPINRFLKVHIDVKNKIHTARWWKYSRQVHIMHILHFLKRNIILWETIIGQKSSILYFNRICYNRTWNNTMKNQLKV